jgi:hypothetical protein
MAATLACEPDGVLSYRSCGAHWEFMRWDGRYLIELTVSGSGSRSRPGLRIHRTRSLDPRDVTRHNGIPVTTPARTLLDLADELPDKGLRRAVRQAQALQLTNVRLIADVLTRANGRHGARRLAALISDGPAPTRSELEDLVLELVLRGGLQRPQINRPLAASTPICGGPSSASPWSATALRGTAAGSLARTTRSARHGSRPAASACCESPGSRRYRSRSRRSRGLSRPGHHPRREGAPRPAPRRHGPTGGAAGDAERRSATSLRARTAARGRSLGCGG